MKLKNFNFRFILCCEMELTVISQEHFSIFNFYTGKKYVK